MLSFYPKNSLNEVTLSGKKALAVTLLSVFTLASPLAAFAAPRTNPFVVGQTLDPGAESFEPCGPTDANCFTTISNASTTAAGLISTTTQSFSGIKNFTGTTTLATTTSTNFFTSILNAVLATITDLLFTNATGTKLTLLNALGVTSGGTGTSTAPVYGQLLMGNASGTYTLVSTSTLLNGFYASTSLGAAVAGASANGIFFLNASGTLSQDTANFNYDSVSKKLTITGGVDPLFLQLKDVTTGTNSGAYLEVFSGNTAATSTAGNARLRYNASTTKFQASIEGGAYTDVLLASSTNIFNAIITNATSTFATTTIAGDLYLSSGLRDSFGATGTAGQYLSSTGTSTKWVTISGSVANGSATGTSLYWNGSAWVQNGSFLTDNVNSTNTGRLNVLGTSTFATTSSSNLFASVFNSIISTVTNLFFTSATGTNLVLTGTSTLATTTATKLTAENILTDNLTATTTNTQNLIAGNSTNTGVLSVFGTSTFATTTLTAATSTSFFTGLFSALLASVTDLFFTNATGTNFVVTGTTTLASTTANKFTTTGTTTLATTTILGDLTLSYGLRDSFGATGTAGQILSSNNGTSTKWISIATGLAGSATGSAQYWNGSSWVENVNFLTDLATTTSGRYVMYGIGSSSLSTSFQTKNLVGSSTFRVNDLGNVVVGNSSTTGTSTIWSNLSITNILTSLVAVFTDLFTTNFVATNATTSAFVTTGTTTLATTTILGNLFANGTNTLASTTFIGDIILSYGLRDSFGATGTDGQVLASNNGTSTKWVSLAGALANGSATGSAMYWNGSNWVENLGFVTDVATTTNNKFTFNGNGTSTTSNSFAVKNLAGSSTFRVNDLGNIVVGNSSTTGTSTIWSNLNITNILTAITGIFTDIFATNITLNGTSTLTVGSTSTPSTTTINGYFVLNGGMRDASGATGTLGQILSSTGSSTKWVNAAAGGLASGTATGTRLFWSGSNWTEDLNFITDLTTSSARYLISGIGSSSDSVSFQTKNLIGSSTFKVNDLGNVVVGNSSTTGTSTIWSNLSITNILTSLVAVFTDLFTTNFVATNSTTTNLVTTGTTTLASTTALVFTTTGTTTLATTTVTKLTAENIVTDNLTATTTNTQNLISGNSTNTGTLSVLGTSTLATTTLTAATSTSFFTNLLSAITGYISNFLFDNATGTNLVAQNITATTTNFGTSTVSNLFTVTGTSTLATTTLSKLTADIATINALTATTTNTNNLTAASSTLGDATSTGLFSVTGTSTLATTTSTNFFADIFNALMATITNLLFTNATGTTLAVNGTSTFTGGVIASSSRVIASAAGVVTSAQFDIKNSGSSDYTFDYNLDGTADANDPTVTLVRGNTYKFNISASGHPMYIKTIASNGTGNQYSTGVTGQGTSNGQMTFTVPMDAPSTLFYNCEFHSSMTGVIRIVNAGVLTDSNGLDRVVATVSGINIYGDTFSTSSATFATATVNTLVATTTYATTSIVNGNSSVGGLLSVLGTSTLATTTLTAATSTSFFTNLLSAITGYISNFLFDNATGTNLVAQNITATTTNFGTSTVSNLFNVTGTSTLATTTISTLTVNENTNLATVTATQINGNNLTVASTTNTGLLTVLGTSTFATTTLTAATATSLYAQLLSALTATINGMLNVAGTSTLATTTVNGTLALSNAQTQSASNAYSQAVIGSDGIIRKAPTINQLSDVLENDIVTAPATATNAIGDAFLLASSTGIYLGEWENGTNTIQTWDGTDWVVYTPVANDRTTVQTGVNAGNIYIFNGSAWVAPAAVSSNNWLVGGNAGTSTLTLGTSQNGALSIIASGTQRLLINASNTAVYGGLVLASSTTGTTTNALYQSAGTLYWNGSALSGLASAASAQITLNYGADIVAGDLVKLNTSGQAVKLATAFAGASTTIQQIGTETTIDTGTTTDAATTFVGTDKIVSVFKIASATNYQARLGVVSGTSTTWYAAVDTGVSATTYPNINDLKPFNTDKFILTTMNGSVANDIRVGQIVGTSLTFGATGYNTQTQLDGSATYEVKVTQINSERIFVFMFNVTGSGGVRVATLVVNANNTLTYDGGFSSIGNSLTQGVNISGVADVISVRPNTATLIFPRVTDAYPRIFSMSITGNTITNISDVTPVGRTTEQSKIIKTGLGSGAYMYSGTSGTWMVPFSVAAGGAFTYGTETILDSQNGAVEIGAACAQDYNCAAFVKRSSGSYVFTPFTASSSAAVNLGLSASTTFGTFNTINNTSNSNLVSDGTGKYSLSYIITSQSADLVNRIIQMGQSVSIDRAGMIGIAQTTAANGANGTISLFSGLSNAHTGFTAGSLLYLNSLGAITSSTTDFLLGRAMSSTTMQLLANNFLAAGATVVSGGSGSSNGAQISDGVDNNTRIETNSGAFDENILRFYTTAVQRMLIDAAGKIGINTSAVDTTNIFQVNSGSSTVGITTNGGINANTLVLGTSTAVASSSNTRLLVQGGVELQGNASNSPSISIAPAASSSWIASVINSLYNIGGELFFNGFKLSNSQTSTSTFNTSYVMVKGITGNSTANGTGHFRFETPVSNYGSDITYDNVTTYTTTINVPSSGRFTLKAGKTYKLASSITGQSSVYTGYGWYNADTNVALGAPANSNDTGAALGYGPNGPATAIFTPQVDTRVEVRHIGGGGSSDTGNATYGQSWATIEMIAGQTAVTGQSVDYATAILPINQSVSAGADVSFALQAGSVAYSAGNFTLIAGRTYELETGLAQDGGVSNGDVTYQWRDNTNNVLLGTVGGYLSPNVNSNQAYNGVATAIITPAANMNVSVRIISATTATLKATSSYAKVTQLGTNAVTEYDAYSYGNFATGGLIIATGTLSQYINHINVAQYTAGQALTLPAPNNANLQRIVYINNTSTTTSFTMYGTPIEKGGSGAFIWNGSQWNAFGNQTVLAEFGETNLTDGSTFTTAFTDITGSSFTLPSAGTWEVEYVVIGGNGTAGTNNLVEIYSSGDVLVANSRGAQTNPTNTNADSIVIANKSTITTGGAATYKLKGRTGSGTFTVRNNATTFTSSGNSKVTWKKIGGYTAITGQTVDYVDARLSASQTGITGATDVAFDTVVSGNIGFSAGVFTLTAGKTYKLESMLAAYSAVGTSAVGKLTYDWVDATSGLSLFAGVNGAAGVGSSGSANVNNSSPIAAVQTYTPSTNQTIKVKIQSVVLGGATSFGVYGDDLVSGSSYARITQLGTTATTETLNSNLGNFATNSPILSASISQYISSYQIAQTTSGVTLTIPSPTNVALSRLMYIDNIGSASFQMHGITVMGGDSVAFKWNGSTWKQFGTAQGTGVIASYMYARFTATQNTNVTNSDHYKNWVVQNTAGPDIAYDSTTAYTNTVNAPSLGRFTLKAGKTYEITADCGTIIQPTGNYGGCWIRNADTGATISSRAEQWNDAASATQAGTDGIGTMYTPTIDTRVEVAIYGSSGGITNIGAGLSGNDSPYINIKVIAGNTAVTGQTIDYVNAALANATDTAVTTGAAIPVVTVAGNIPNTLGVFTLSAGKTYKLTGSAAYSATSGANSTIYQWRDITSNTLIGNSALIQSPQAGINAGSQPTAEAVITPSTNITVRLENITGVTRNFTGTSASVGGTYVTIQQLGSTASTEYSVNSLPDQTVDGNIFATNVSQYINHVNINQATAGRILGINSPENIALQRIIYINNIGGVSFMMHGALVNAQESMAFIWNGSTWKSFGNQTANVLAEYGEKTTFDATSFGNSSTQIMNFTLPSAGVWEVEYHISGYGSGTLGDSSMWIQDSTTAVVTGSPQHLFSTAAANGGNTENFTADQTVRITTAGAATYYLRGQTTSATYNIYQGTCSQGAGGSCSKVTYKKISGYVPVTGQTVEYLYAGYATAGTNLPVALTTYQNNGILVTGNVITLKGGKTYELKANMGVNDGGQDHACWKTYPAQVSLPGRPCNYITGSSAGYRDSGEASLIYTPASDVQVAFYDEGTISGYSDGATIFVRQIGTSAVNSDSYLAVGGNIFSSAAQYMNIGTQANNGIQFIASSTVVGGFAYSNTTNTATLFVGTSSPNVLAMKDINLWIQGSARLAASGTVGSALVIDQGTTGVSTTTNALYALNGKLFYNGAEIYYGASTSPNQVVASYMSGYLSANQTLSTSNLDHACFNSIQSSFGSDITLDTTSACTTGSNPLNVANRGRITLKAGKTYKLTAYPNTSSSGAFEMVWENADTGVALSARQSVYANNASWGTTNNPVTTIFTPTSDTRVQLRHNYTPSGTSQILRGDSVNGFGGTNDSGATTFMVELIAGAAAVTGQTVDYLEAGMTSNQSGINNNSATPIVFNVARSGNVPLNTSTGVITLSAGKTYELTANIRGSVAAAAETMYYQFVDATTGAALAGGTQGQVNSLQYASAHINSQQIAHVIHTATANQTVRLDTVVGGSGTGVVGNTGTYLTVKQLGTTAMTAETIWSTQGNNFTANSIYNLGTLSNSGLRFMASSSAMAGLTYNASSSQGVFYIGTTTVSNTLSQNFSLYANGTGGFVSSSTVNGPINALYIGNSSVSSAASSATNTDINLLRGIQLYIDGAIAKLAKKTVNGVDIGAALVIESATSSVATTTDALYALNGQLFYNGFQLYTGTTSNQVAASYIDVYRTSYINPVSANTVIPFQTVRAQAGADISYSTTTGIFTLKAGRTYKLSGVVPTIYGGNGYINYQWYNVTAGAAVANTDVTVFTAGYTTSVSSGSGPAEFIVTPSSDTQYMLRTGASVSGATYLGDGQVTGQSHPRANIQVIAGNAAVIGQSVDYVYAIPTATANLAVNSAVPFTSVVSGNVTNLGSGRFRLNAGKTYNLETVVAVATNANDTSYRYQWYNVTDSAAIGNVNGGGDPTGTIGFASPAVTIISPAVTTDIEVRIVADDATTLSTDNSYLKITQLGSSAITSDSFVNIGGNNYTGSSTLQLGTTNTNSILAFITNSIAKLTLGTTTTNYLKLNGYGAGTLTTDASGNVTASSDGVLKQISGSFDRGLSSILGLAPATYKWTNGSGLDTAQSYTGFIAQNVKDFIPEAVGTSNDGTLTLSDRPILAALVNATKELNNKNEVNSLQISSLAEIVGLSTSTLADIRSGYMSNITTDNENRFTELRTNWDTLRMNYEAQKLVIDQLASTTYTLSQEVNAEANADTNMPCITDNLGNQRCIDGGTFDNVLKISGLIDLASSTNKAVQDLKLELSTLNVTVNTLASTTQELASTTASTTNAVNELNAKVDALATTLNINAVSESARQAADLLSLASTTFATTTEIALDANGNVIATTTVDTFAGSFWKNVKVQMITWLADVTNGITNIFAKEVNTEKLCVSKADGTKVCLDANELEQVKNGEVITPAPTQVVTIPEVTPTTEPVTPNPTSTEPVTETIPEVVTPPTDPVTP